MIPERVGRANLDDRAIPTRGRVIRSSEGPALPSLEAYSPPSTRAMWLGLFSVGPPRDIMDILLAVGNELVEAQLDRAQNPRFLHEYATTNDSPQRRQAK